MLRERVILFRRWYECMQVIRKISSCMFVRVYSRVRLELKLQANEHAKFDFFSLVK